MYVLVIIGMTIINPTVPTSILTVTGFKSMATCTHAGEKVSKHSGIIYECLEVK